MRLLVWVRVPYDCLYIRTCASRECQRLEEWLGPDFPPSPPKKPTCGCPDSRAVACEMMDVCGLSHPLCGTWLWKPWETNTQTKKKLLVPKISKPREYWISRFRRKMRLYFSREGRQTTSVESLPWTRLWASLVWPVSSSNSHCSNKTLVTDPSWMRRSKLRENHLFSKVTLPLSGEFAIYANTIGHFLCLGALQVGAHSILTTALWGSTRECKLFLILVIFEIF